MDSFYHSITRLNEKNVELCRKEVIKIDNGIGKLSVRVAQYYFNATNKRPTAATMKQAIGQAKSLLNAGFVAEEIIIVINELIERPPKNGFNSLGFLAYVMEEVLQKHKAKLIKEEQSIIHLQCTGSTDITTKVYQHIERTQQSVKQRLGDEFDTNLFREGMK